MKISDASKVTGIKEIRSVSEHTTTVVLNNNHCYPASPAEVRMWELINKLCEEE